MRTLVMVLVSAIGLIGVSGCTTADLLAAMDGSDALVAKMAESAGTGDMLQTRTCTQAQDCTCDPNGTPIQQRDRDRSCAKIQTQDQIRLQLRDGSCQQ